MAINNKKTTHNDVFLIEGPRIRDATFDVSIARHLVKQLHRNMGKQRKVYESRDESWRPQSNLRNPYG